MYMIREKQLHIITMFYIKPPIGPVSLDILESCVFARLEYLELLNSNKTHEFEGKFEYLLENSSYDRIGHFMLRLLLSTYSDIVTNWIEKETLLFNQRLSHITPRQLHKLLKKILAEVKILVDTQPINKTLEEVCTFFLKPEIFRHILAHDHKKKCKKFQCKVKFKAVPDLIRKREVELYASYAILDCSQWKQLLSSLFSTYVTRTVASIHQRAQYIMNYDTRLHILQQKICSKIMGKNYHNKLSKHTITVETIDREAANFPLCMQNLHNRLRATHRLSHYARLHYGLFLKDSGMMLQDAIHFWREEYSKPHTCASTCSHNWQSSEKKFLYSIRHLYGLEGSRKNYLAPNCEYLCNNRPGTSYEGGCPFSNFDKRRLRNLLQISLSGNEAEKFLDTITSKTPQTACMIHFKLLHKQSCNISSISSPVQYYAMSHNETYS